METIFDDNDIVFDGDITINKEDVFFFNILLKNTNSILDKLKINKIINEYDKKDIVIKINFNFFINERVGELEVLIYSKKEKEIEQIIKDIFYELKENELKLFLRNLNKYLIKTKKQTIENLVSLEPNKLGGN